MQSEGKGGKKGKIRGARCKSVIGGRQLRNNAGEGAQKRAKVDWLRAGLWGKGEEKNYFWGKSNGGDVERTNSRKALNRREKLGGEGGRTSEG